MNGIGAAIVIGTINCGEACSICKNMNRKHARKKRFGACELLNYVKRVVVFPVRGKCETNARKVEKVFLDPSGFV